MYTYFGSGSPSNFILFYAAFKGAAKVPSTNGHFYSGEPLNKR